jgi:hypothetical protein
MSALQFISPIQEYGLSGDNTPMIMIILKDVKIHYQQALEGDVAGESWVEHLS